MTGSPSRTGPLVVFCFHNVLYFYKDTAEMPESQYLVLSFLSLRYHMYRNVTKGRFVTFQLPKRGQFMRYFNDRECGPTDALSSA
jgi:hypothetical protein